MDILTWPKCYRAGVSTPGGQVLDAVLLIATGGDPERVATFCVALSEEEPH